MNSHLWLIVAVIALGSGPLFQRLARSRPLAMSALDGFSCTAVAGLVMLHGLPDAFDHAGWWAAFAALLGLIGPTVFERWRKRLAPQAHAAALALAVLGLGVHAFADGGVLAGGNTGLTLAIVLHRVPVSLALWMLLLGSYSISLRGGALAALGVATVAGFFTGAALFGDAHWLGLLEGLVSGSLLHVVFHRPVVSSLPTAALRQWARTTAGLGALVGAALAVGAHLTTPHGASAASAGAAAHEVFLAMALESAPALLLAYFGAGLLDSFMPRGTVAWLQRGSSFSHALRGVGFGLPLPICSCGVIPLYRSLVVKGTPAAAALAFLVATPEIGIDAVLLSLPLLGLHLTAVRVVSAAIVAVVAGWVVGRVTPRAATAPAPGAALDAPQSASIPSRIAHGLRSGFGEVVDNTGPWILLGLAIAAVGAKLLDPLWFRALPNGAGIVLFALIGIPSYVCATGATPLVTMFIAKGVSPGAALAFLLTGPATNATTFGVLSQLHGPRTAGFFGLVVTALAVALGFAVNGILPHPEVFPVTASGHLEHASILSWVCLTALGLVFAASLLRQGPRAFLGRIFTLDDKPDTHEHQSGCDDDHGCGC